MKDLRCRYCQQVFQSSAYHPQRTVCNQPGCQHQRQRDYHRQKIATDPVDRQVCLESPRKWRLAHPDYWKQYRQSHPQQVERNRRQQRLRDQKRQLGNLANNNLASRKILSFQASSHPEPDFSILANNIPLARLLQLAYRARHALEVLRIAVAD